MNLGNATGPPITHYGRLFANQVLAQMYLYERKFADLKDEKKSRKYLCKVLPKNLMKKWPKTWLKVLVAC